MISTTFLSSLWVGDQMNDIQFNALTEKDLMLLYQWFQEPTIKHWYARDQSFSLEDIRNKYLPRILGQENVPSFIVYQNNLPVGFIQYYCIGENLPKHPSPKEPLTQANPLFQHHDPMEIAGIDCFIAHQKNRGNGLGKKIINAFIQQFLLNFSIVIVDPEQHNTQATRCYEQCGFQPSSYSEASNILIMIKNIMPKNKINNASIKRNR